MKINVMMILVAKNTRNTRRAKIFVIFREINQFYQTKEKSNNKH